MLLIDRLLSLVFVLLYNLYNVLRRGEVHKVEVMICRYRYSGGSGQESIEKYTLEDTLVNYIEDRKNIAFYYWDTDQPFLGFGLKFYSRVLWLNPKYLVLSSYAPSGVFYQPMPWILSQIKKKKIRTIALWWDTCNPVFVKSITPVIDSIDVHGIIENPNLNIGDSKDAQRIKQKACVLYSPFDIELEERERDIDVAFLGQTSSYRSIRKPYIDYLLESNIPLHYSAYEKSQQCSHAKYYEILSRSKIGINFSMSTDRFQLKARVFEIMHTGGLLLEERNDQIEYYFTEGLEFVAFSSQEELLEKIRYYLEHENERIQIALAGHKRARQLFNGRQFWNKVLSL
jgi:hypothetical protein